MIEQAQRTRWTNIVYVLFFLSGISGLVYETVWLRMLTRVLGSTVYATSIILAVYMSGMALGSYIAGKYSDRMEGPLKVYAYLELLIGISAIFFMLVFGHLLPIYRFLSHISQGNRLLLALGQSGVLYLLLLVPTSMMGATLPVLLACTRGMPLGFARRAGLLYGLNTLGAVVGVLGSGLFTIGALGERASVNIAVIINLMVSLIALRLLAFNHKGTGERGAAPDEAISPYGPAVRRIILIFYIICGFTAMGYEVIWSRIFQLYLGTSIYSFSLMLGVYLLGLALGSVLASRLVGRSGDPLWMVGLLQLAVSLYGLSGFHLLKYFSPASLTNYIDIRNIVLVPLAVVFPMTFAMGFIFPAVSKGYTSAENAASRGVANIYSLNTIGGIIGSLVCGFVLLGSLGTKNSFILLSGLNFIAGAVFLMSSLKRRYSHFALVLLFGIAAAIVGLRAGDPFLDMVKIKAREIWGPQTRIFYHHESVYATTTAFGNEDNARDRQLWINGIGMTHLCTEAKLMAHLPILLNGRTKEMLVVCFGMGTTVRSGWSHRDINCDAVEIVPEVYQCFQYFHKDARSIVNDPRIRLYADDGRNFLLLRDKKYDVITMDPAPPLWSAGTVNLYSREFLELCLSRLDEGGIMCLWVPPDRATEVRMIMSTFNAVFPRALVFGGIKYSGIFLLGSRDEIGVDPVRFRQAGKDSSIVADLREWEDFLSAPDRILNFYLFGKRELGQFVKGAPIITDDQPYTEFPLWRHRYHPFRNYYLNAAYLSEWETAWRQSLGTDRSGVKE
jgi:spermidine synthase